MTRMDRYRNQHRRWRKGGPCVVCNRRTVGKIVEGLT